MREIDAQERRALLVRIQSSVPVYTDTLQPETETAESVFVAGEQLAGMSLLGRIVLFFRSLLSGKDRVTLLEERYLKRLAVAIERENPALIDVAAGEFLEGMREELLLLRAQARALFPSLREVLGRRRREFFAFLARHELRDFRERLEEETDPRTIWENGRFSDERQVRALMIQRFHELTDAIPEAGRREVGRDAGALFALYGLSRHPFEDLLSAFRGEEETVATFPDLKKPLNELARCLEALHTPPSARALYDLFLFLHQEHLEEPEFDLERQLADDMGMTHSALAGIRRFHERVPLPGFMRLIYRDPQYRASPLSPSADWFTFYRDFWRQWVHHRYLEFYHSRRHDALLSEALDFLALESLPRMINYRRDKFGPNTPVRHEFSLSVVRGFLKSIFAPLSRSLKLIHLNAEFYKEENRHAYTDAFLFLEQVDARIEDFESILGPQGELRGEIQKVKAQPLGSRLRQKRISDILARADGQARTLLDAFIEQVESLKSLLYGILKGQPGDRYDTLVNLGKIGGRENSSLRDAWSRAMGSCDRAADLLKKIRELEINRYAGPEEG
ncbi:MAG: hypothetical protein JXB06_07125 [Spirochaetales bacterium]|nr:hypothetical protein [Spirochaetales bacterium]